MVKQKEFHCAETKIYLAIWISAVSYAIYNFTVTSQKYFQHFYDSYDDFAPGWSHLNFRKRDKADFEWETIGFFLMDIYPIMIFYLVVSETIRYLDLDIKLQQYFQTMLSLLYLTYHMGYKITVITLFQPVFFYLVTTFGSKTLIWICNLTSLALIAVYKQMNTSDQFLNDLKINHTEAYLNVLLLCWLNLKCTSYSLNMLSKARLVDFFAYCFYFPTVFTGPFISYEDFKETYKRRSFASLDARIRKIGWNILRCEFWFMVANFCLHYIYVNATTFQLGLVKKLDLCSLCGYGYLMGQFFHIKYVVLYGLSTSLASFENIPVPSLPRCIGRVHLYSDMWKFFDPGLYTFLKMHIFIPSRKLGSNKFLSSFLCFFFVYIWHGIEDYIFIWAALNFLGVALESLTDIVYETKLKHINFVKSLHEKKLRRVRCALAAPLLAMSSVSNFYFFAGKDVGDVFVQKAFGESIINKALLLFMLYCCCEVSTELRNVNAHRM